MSDAIIEPTPDKQRECLVVVAHFPPIGGGGVVRIVNFVRALSGSGWRVTVLTPDTAFAEACERPMLDAEMLASIERDVRIVHVPFKRTYTRLLTRVRELPAGSAPAARLRRAPYSLLLRAIGLWNSIVLRTFSIDPYSGFRIPALREARRLRRDGYRPEVVIATSPPHSVQYTGARVASVLGASFVGDLRDQWYGNPHPLVMGRPGLNKSLEHAVVSRSCAMTTATEESAEQLCRVHGEVLRSRVHWMPNGFDGAAWEDVDEQPATDRLVLTYVGTLYEPRDIEPLARAIEDLRSRDARFLDSFTLRLVGPVSDSYITRLHHACADSLDVVGSVSQTESLRYMSRSSALLVILHPGEGSETAIPGKIYEYMAACRPLVALVGEGAARGLITEENLGVVADPSNAAEIADALEKLVVGWRGEGLGSLWKAPSAEVLERYDRRSIAARFAQLVEECADRSR